MAFGITREELNAWKKEVRKGEIAFLTHFWLHPRYPGIKTVTKAGSSDLNRLIKWGISYGLKEDWIHHRHEYPHFDLFGDIQKQILYRENLWGHIHRFRI